MKIFIFFFSVCLITISCSQDHLVISQTQTNTHDNSVSQLENSKEEKLPKKLPVSREKIDLPNIKGFDISNFLITSGVGEIYGHFLNRPKIGESVTVIPLEVDFEAFDLKIASVTKSPENCGDETPTLRWEFKLEKTTRKDILAIEPFRDMSRAHPFNVAIIYPAVKFAKLIEINELKSETLPKSVTANTIYTAIDLTNDKTPDLLYAESRYEDHTIALGEVVKGIECSDTSMRYYQKTKNGWKLIDLQRAC